MFVRNPEPSENQVEDVVLYFFSFRSVLVYEAVISCGTFILLGGLTLWHARIISNGETSIEAHINKSETKRLSQIGQTYKNPYDFGPYHNLRLFLGIIEGRNLTSVIFPSNHPPRGDGSQWDSIYSCGIDWRDVSLVKTLDLSKLA